MRLLRNSRITECGAILFPTRLVVRAAPFALLTKTLWIVVALGVTGIGRAEVPPEIAKQIAAIGRGVCAAETAQVYRPLHPTAPYPGVAIARDISFGPDPKNVLDVVAKEKGGGSRPVLIFVSGGPGNKQQGGPNGAPFYDNIMLWAVKNGMVGVNMQRRPGEAWDDPAKDVGRVVRWVEQNIAQYSGNPGRVFLWSQSAGNIPVSTYISHPEFHGAKGAGVKGVVFMSPAPFDILPATPPKTEPNPPCGQPTPGAAAAAPAGPGGGNGQAGGGRGNAATAPADTATQLARSNLPGLIKSNVPFLLSSAELDPPALVAFAETFRDQLCKAGRCPTYQVLKDHGHISEVMSANTADDSVTGPILKWMQNIK